MSNQNWYIATWFFESISLQCIELTHFQSSKKHAEWKWFKFWRQQSFVCFTWCCLYKVQRVLWTNHRALYDTLVKSCNGEWIDYRSSELQPTTVLQITFLKDVFSITNGLCLLLQSEKKILEEFPEPLIQLWWFLRKWKKT